MADNATRARSVDSLLNFETVKYYGAEAYEVGAFREAVLNFQVLIYLKPYHILLLNKIRIYYTSCLYDLYTNQFNGLD